MLILMYTRPTAGLMNRFWSAILGVVGWSRVRSIFLLIVMSIKHTLSINSQPRDQWTLYLVDWSMDIHSYLGVISRLRKTRPDKKKRVEKKMI
jgi:hypothetical protein